MSLPAPATAGQPAAARRGGLLKGKAKVAELHEKDKETAGDHRIVREATKPSLDRPQPRRGLQFTAQPFTLSWSKIKRKLLLASTGTPSSGEGRSESSQTSADSRRALAQAYARNQTLHLSPNGAGGHGKQVHMGNGEDEEDWQVDQTVVDTEFWDEDGHLISSSHPGSTGGHGHERMSASGKDTTTAHSEDAASLIKSPTFKVIDGVYTFIAGYIIPKCKYFFEPRFGDEDKEINFRKERWYNTKRNAMFCSIFLIINWALVLGLSTFASVPEKIMWYGIYTLVTWPVPLFIAFDLPRKSQHLYSICGALATCSLCWYGVITMRLCHFLNGDTCNGNQFLLVQYYAAAFPMLGLFAMGVNRAWIAAGQLTYWVLICGLALPDKPAFARQVVNYLLFSIFIQYLHYSQEKIDRRMFTLRTQLKISYRAQQKAQIAEKKANNSKKKFISYIFHEVRVPLNTAYLAFQNLQAVEAFNRRDDDQMTEVYALESSLQQVQQVLNDVLDLQRMDAGRFESVSQPFHFHRAINALVASLKSATTAKKLGLNVSLDERIDQIPQSIDWRGGRATFVIGDEIRLRQVLTNLASNAVKFSTEGKGQVSVSTKLIWPDIGDANMKLVASAPTSPGLLESLQPWSAAEITPVERDPKVTPMSFGNSSTDSDNTFVSNGNLEEEEQRRPSDADTDVEKLAGTTPHRPVVSADMAYSRPHPAPIRTDSDESTASDRQQRMNKRDCVIVRIEISDNGPGIRPSDLVDLRLFSPYVQTEVGRTQGGKGSGLGLAIVRAIVQLAHGRLGVKSSKHGSTFWLEFRYPLAKASEVHVEQEPMSPYSTHSSVRPPSAIKRPPIKPYKDGESSYSQYSASRHEVASSQGLPVTPFAEADKSLGSSPGVKASSHRPSTSESRQGSVSAPSIATTSAIGAIDTASPLTSEQWQPSGVIERQVLPSMTVTAPTPPQTTPVPRVSSRSKIPTPSPPLSEGRANRSPSVAKLSDSIPQATPASPIGEDAFTPLTREALKAIEKPPPLPGMPSVPERSEASDQVQTPKASVLAAHVPPAASETKTEKPLTALVVDDDPLTRKLMTRMMTRLGCIVDEAENGQIFLDILLGVDGKPPRTYSICTLDNAMPVMTGEQAVRELRKAGRNDFVVGATGNALRSDQNAYLQAGVNYVMCKPISVKDLKAHLVEARQRQDAQDAATQ